MQGIFGGVLTGGLVSVLALSVASVVSEQPAGRTPPAPPLVEAPQVDGAAVEGAAVDGVAAESDTQTGPRTPVGSVSIDEPVAPALPENTSEAQAPASPPLAQSDVSAPLADTDPLDEPSVVAIEGAMTAPDAQTGVAITADPDEPVFPSPQAAAPQTPMNEADLTVSTTPAAPLVQQDAADGETGEAQAAVPVAEDVFVVDLGTDAVVETAPVADADGEADGADAGSETSAGGEASAGSEAGSEAMSVDAQDPTPDQTGDQITADGAAPDPQAPMWT